MGRKRSFQGYGGIRGTDRQREGNRRRGKGINGDRGNGKARNMMENGIKRTKYGLKRLEMCGVS